MSISVDSFLRGIDAIQKDNPSYMLGHSGDDGYCDCIGLLIGAIRRAGGAWSGTHGSNYAARSEVEELLTINNTSQLKRGMAVFKGKTDISNLPKKYQQGGSSYNGDLHDYYHVGVVYSVNPLCIKHCTTGNGKDILEDTKLGKWGYAGRLKKVTYDADAQAEEGDKMENYMVTATGGVNMRKRTSTTSDKICSIPEGTTVEAKAIADGWLQVLYKGQTGYCVAKYLTEWEDATNLDDTVSDDVSLASLLDKITALTKRVDALERSVGVG